MATINDVLGWDPDALGGVVDTLITKRRDLTDLQDEIDAARPPLTWRSDVGDLARTSHEALRLRLLDMVAEVGTVLSSVDFAQEELATARTELQTALDAAAAEGFTVDRTSGEVTSTQAYDEGDADGIRAAQRVTEIAGDISVALGKADVADADLAAALQSAVDGEVDGGTGSLGDAGVQLPVALEGMSAEEIALRYADDVALSTVRAWIDAELEFATWEAEAGAEATYVVRGNGEVVMNLHLEGGLGREIDVGAGEVDLSGGVTTDLELTFGSPEEAEAFLEGLDDAAFDMEWWEYGNAPAAVATNVAEYVGQQDVTSFRTGVYGEASAEFDTSWADAEATGRVDGYYDWVRDEYGLQVSANLEAELGGEGSGYNGAGQLTGQAKLDGDGELQEVTFTGSISATMANERLGLDLPSTSTGAGADVELRMDRENPYFEEFQQATTSGDLDEAAGLALDHGRVVVRATVIESLGSDEHEFDIGVAGAEVEYGATATVADQVWVRPPGQDYVIPIDPQEIP